MKVSAFTFLRNGQKLCYPFMESIYKREREQETLVSP